MFITIVCAIKTANDSDYIEKGSSDNSANDSDYIEKGSSDNSADRTIVKKNSDQRYGVKSLLIVGSGSAISGAIFGGLYVFTTDKQEKEMAKPKKENEALQNDLTNKNKELKAINGPQASQITALEDEITKQAYEIAKQKTTLEGVKNALSGIHGSDKNMIIKAIQSSLQNGN